MWLQGKDQHTGSVWGMLCFVSGFGVYFSKRLDHGSRGSRRYTRIKGADCLGIGLPKSVRQRQRSCLLEEASGLCGKRILPPLWTAAYWAAEICSAEATELPVWKRPPVSVANGFCHPWDWIPAQITPPNRCALWRGP
jgi:hypothetical protein